MSTGGEKARSPYQRHKKSPYKYSETYNLWRDAMKRGDAAAAANYARSHYNRFVRYAPVNSEPEGIAA